MQMKLRLWEIQYSAQSPALSGYRSTKKINVAATTIERAIAIARGELEATMLDLHIWGCSHRGPVDLVEVIDD
jgi:hypothetical protein